MKKYVQIIVALGIVVAVIWMAKSGIAWASGLPASQSPVELSGPASAQDDSSLAPPPYKTEISESGVYNIGGICLFNVEYKGTNVKNNADAEVPIEESGQVPFSGKGRLLFPGCHVVHYKDGQIVREANTTDGNWKICFGDNPDMKNLQIYYYLDDPGSGFKMWIPLETTVENTLVCAPARFTGVYMPAGETARNPGLEPGAGATTTEGGGGGSVITPPSDITITSPGTYSAGGICSAIIKYYIPSLGDNLHVQFPTEDTKIVPFPANSPDLLYLPGCHFLHYRDGKVQQVMTSQEGEWQICFAARPGKEMTIYYYQDDNSDVNPPWVPLETKTENGLACAPLADYSGVYAPAGK